MFSAIALVSCVVAVVAAVLLVRVSLASARRRRQIDALMLRITELEERLTRDAEEPGPAMARTAVAGGATDDEGTAEAYSADVLAGWTSHVGRILARHATPEDLADRAVVTVYRRIDEPIKPSDLAGELHVSLRTLERGLSRALDCSPGRLILAVKMREARRMLATGRLQVGDVAHRLAFFDSAHFAKRYRQFYRCPPSRHLAEGRKGTAAA
jgi:AraC-like DNA-binding protein